MITQQLKAIESPNNVDIKSVIIKLNINYPRL